jgi:preprotein translocase subunit SecE
MQRAGGSRVPAGRTNGDVKTGLIDSMQSGVSGRWNRGRTFLAEVRNELKRVTWPSRKEVYATTVVVILTSIFFGLYLFSVDIVLNGIVTWIFRQFGAA